MNTPLRGNAPITVGIDDSQRAIVAARWAASAAAHRHAPLRLLHATGYTEAVAGALPPAQRLWEELQRAGADALALAMRAVRETADVPVEEVLVDDPPARALLKAAKDSRMVVIGGSGHPGAVKGLLVGSLATQLSGHAEAPVAVIRGDNADRRPEREPIVVGVDGSPLSTAAIAAAFEEAALRNAPLVAVHVWSDTDTSQVFNRTRMMFDWEPIERSAERLLAEQLAGWGEKYPDVPVQRRIVRDRPAHALLEEGEHAQLIVVGSRGRGGFRGLLFGSTSQNLIHHAACPVLVVRPTGEFP
ncbi:universal stress protein [Thermocrispum municipale]|uniref:universal stress protein n=1 Tax=Thermocrispum municipale TaxID=37926 RepID=UPI000407C0B4|nr:universal stress protein [Thermocrispum municipale]